MTDLHHRRILAKRALKAGNTEAAVSHLFEMIKACAEEKDFRKAEALRDHLYDINPGAVHEIVRAGEIIEQAKCDSMDKCHRSLWSGLYSALTTEAGNELYYSLKPVHFQPGRTLFEQGAQNPALFFIENGEVKLSCRQGGLEMHLKTAGPGEVLGGETFFAKTALCTYSAAAQTPVQAGQLERPYLERWVDDFPDLAEKLRSFWQQQHTIPSLLESLAVDRRRQKRVRLTGSIAGQLLDQDGKPANKPFKAELSDLSTGGLAFIVASKQERTIRVLLGRRLALQCEVPLIGGREELRKLGRIIGVEALPFDEYCFHVCFEKPLPGYVIRDIDTSSMSSSPGLELELEE